MKSQGVPDARSSGGGSKDAVQVKGQKDFNQGQNLGLASSFEDSCP